MVVSLGCMYVCMYVCMDGCMDVCMMYVWMYGCVCSWGSVLICDRRSSTSHYLLHVVGMRVLVDISRLQELHAWDGGKD